jgi:hypothetical protein
MKVPKIICITDYKNRFGSKWNSKPYESGFDKTYLSKLFESLEYDLTFIPASSVDFFNPSWKNQIVLYTSSEEYGYYYKNYIEDIIYGLQEAGAILLPGFPFLKANNNKVFMEILRQIRLPADLRTINASFFGTYEELDQAIISGKIEYPSVIKKAAGAMSRGVFLANNENELRKKAKIISRTRNVKVALKEFGRRYKHKGYMSSSNHQGKFIIQPFVPGLKNDWKVLVYGEKYFILKRNVKENDFRASGSGYNYTSGSQAGFPVNMLDFIRDFYLCLNVPNLSIDFAYDGKNGYIFEFQALYFGTSTQYKSKDFYEYDDGNWKLKKNNYDIEEVYVQSIVEFLNRNKL